MHRILLVPVLPRFLLWLGAMALAVSAWGLWGGTSGQLLNDIYDLFLLKLNCP
jgi:hypothetical protein